MDFKKEVSINVGIIAGAAVGLLAAGAAGGWFAARARLRGDFERRLDEEAEAVRLHYYNRASKESSPADILRVAAENDSTAPDLAGDFDEQREWEKDSDGRKAEPSKASRNTFSDYEAEPAPGGDAGAEVAEVDEPEPEEDDRDHSKPYPIAPHEYANTEPGWDSIGLVFWAGDGVLTDDKHDPIIHYEKLVGQLSPEIFGGISGQENLRIVRNDARECDYEIVLREESFADVVLNYGRPK
jgi:hypothetical protein